ncbi:MAG TPA: hypothetical protein VF714_10175 [Jatrophihabitans sp.]|jgi:hypothetical protein
MLRKLLVTLVALGTTVGLMVPTATSASALGGEWLGCQVIPGQGYYSNGCWGGSSSNPVIVDFVVMDETAPSTYSWAVPSVYLTKISDGCQSTTNYCQLTVGRGGKEITMSVTLSQNGATETLTSTASIEPMCGTQWC